MPDFDGPKENARAWDQGHHGVRGLFAGVFRHRKQLDLPHPFVSLAKFEAGKPGGESAPCYIARRSQSFPGDTAILRWPQD